LFFYEGGLKYDQEDYLQSIISFEHSLKASRAAAEVDTYDYSIGHLYVSLGLSYSLINDWENAQLNYQKAIKEFEKTNDSSGIARA
jgi:tetratricopeptide (TPR) repeat protein